MLNYVQFALWASTRDFGTYIGRDATKPVFGVYDKASFKPVSSATESS